jgi:gamma-glutamyltranspeptidase/glutathione hydrolase
MMALAHQEHGNLSWEELFEPAIKLSRQGFKLSPRLYGLLARFNKLLDHPSSRAYFYLENGEPKPVGTLLKNPDYAESLELLASKGASAFYEGSLSKRIAVGVSDDSVKPGSLTAADMKRYQAVIRMPLCSDYRGYRVCTTPPPSSGATVLQILGTLEQLPQPAPQPGSVGWIHRFAEASRLSFADRDTYIADPDFVEVPAQAMISPAYLKQRSQLINLKQASAKALPGQPDIKVARVQSASPEYPSTSHLSIIDAEGNAVSMTSSIQMAFGSGIMVGGFLLNNQLTDFSFVPKDGDQKLIANRIQAGKRPRSSMSPTIVLKDGRPVLLIGSPGGSRIIDYVARVIAYCLEGEEGIAQAIASPNIVDMNRRLELEKGGFSPQTIEQLRAMGHVVAEVDLNSGLHGITVDKNGFTGGADPRREGVALGQ